MSAVVLVEHRLSSVGPQLQALACTLGYAMRARAFLKLGRFGATLAGVLSPTAVPVVGAAGGNPAQRGG
jgi:hypothetical protein